MSGQNPALIKAQLRKQGINPGKVRKKSASLLNFGKRIKPLDIALFTRQMATMMKAGVPLLRYKGVLNIAGEDRRLVFQGVLKLYGFDWDTEWAQGEPRESVMVFIADDLPETKIRAGFARLTD